MIIADDWTAKYVLFLWFGYPCPAGQNAKLKNQPKKYVSNNMADSDWRRPVGTGN